MYGISSSFSHENKPNLRVNIPYMDDMVIINGFLYYQAIITWLFRVYRG